MINVTVNITGIILCCDKNIQSIDLGNGYLVEKTHLDVFSFKDRIVDGRGDLNFAYLDLQLHDDNDTYFMCFNKTDVYQIEEPRFAAGQRVFTDKDFMPDPETAIYEDRERTYLYNIFSLLRLFKGGNIGWRDIFFEYSFTTMGFFKNKIIHQSNNVVRNTADNRYFTLSIEEIIKCNNFLADYKGKPYELMKPIIDEFIWGLDQTDLPTGFEQFTTALEMTLLATNQQGKKQALANRVAILLGSNDTDIQQLHSKMIDFYRYRSESLHEGDGSNITDVEMIEMEDIVRRVLCKLLDCCKSELSLNSSITWASIKSDLIAELILKVTDKKDKGILP